MADENYDGDKDLDFYHDDPDHESNDKPDRKKNIVIGFSASIVLIVSAIFYLPSSIGGSIAVDAGAKKEFGAGVSARTACSGTNSLVIATSSSNSAASESPSPSPSQLDLSSTSLKLSSITVSNIPATCAQKDFIIRVYDESGNKLPLFNSTSTDAYVYMNSKSAYRAGLDSTGLTVTSISTSKFQVTFNTPVSTSIDVKSITIESAPPSILFNCKDYFDCSIGDEGPGGGTIFYVNSEGFDCGSLFSPTGSPTGGKCNFLEVAPPSFLAPVYSPRVISNMNPVRVLTVPNEQIAGVANWTAGVSSNIGGGFRNTEYIISQNNNTNSNLSCTTISVCRYAHNITRLFNSNGFSDWYLPTVGEATQLCKWIYGQAYVSDTQACANSGTINSGYSVWTLNKGGGLILSEFQSKTVMTIMIANGNTCGGSPVVGTLTRWGQSNISGNTCQNFFVIPIRAF